MRLQVSASPTSFCRDADTTQIIVVAKPFELESSLKRRNLLTEYKNCLKRKELSPSAT